jgi:hypothetical protein
MRTFRIFFTPLDYAKVKGMSLENNIFVKFSIRKFWLLFLKFTYELRSKKAAKNSKTIME